MAGGAVPLRGWGAVHVNRRHTHGGFVMSPLPPLTQPRLGLHHALGDAMLAATYEALNAQEYEPPSRGYVVVGDLPDDCCDRIVVALTRVVNARPAMQGECEVQRWTGAWTIRVVRDCDATLGTVYNQLPPDGKEAAVNGLLFADLAVMVDQVAPIVALRACRAVYPTATLGPHFDYERGGLTPYRQGGCAGWTYDFRLTVPGQRP